MCHACLQTRHCGRDRIAVTIVEHHTSGSGTRLNDVIGNVGATIIFWCRPCNDDISFVVNSSFHCCWSTRNCPWGNTFRWQRVSANTSSVNCSYFKGVLGAIGEFFYLCQCFGRFAVFKSGAGLCHAVTHNVVRNI